MSRPVIGVAVWRRGLDTPIGTPEPLHAVADAYVRAVSEAGGIPLLIPAARPTDEAEAAIDRVDGLVLTGGGDVDPATYGAARAGSYDDDPSADRWEIALIDRARSAGRPLLAICRGMQILNVALGGTLHQEIGAPGALHEPIGGSPDAILARRHPVSLAPGGTLAGWHGTDSLSVNTIHHQAIDDLGAGLEIEATAPDGVIEGIRSPADWMAVGVQWHPERLPELAKPLFGGFLNVM